MAVERGAACFNGGGCIVGFAGKDRDCDRMASGGVLYFIGIGCLFWDFMFHKIQKLPFIMAGTICRGAGV